MPDFDASADAFGALGRLGLAALAGFLIGFEREWTQGLEKQQHTFAGARTFTLIGFIGGLAGMLGGAVLAVGALVVVGALTILAHWFEAKETQGRGGTTEMAIFATLLLGYAAGEGHVTVAAAGAVGVAIVLSMKDAVLSVARMLERREVHAALRFLAISVLILPVLPDQTFGPYDAFNPRDLWTMVVLISGLSFLGYFLVKALGDERGILATGVVGGLASSTATTLSLSRFAREGAVGGAVASGIIMANVVMLGRVAIILAALSRPVLVAIAPVLAVSAVVGAAFAFLLWRSAPKMDGGHRKVALGNPFELKPALIFAFILAAVSLASAWGADRFGAAGIYAIAFISGLADVDAIALSAGRQAEAGLSVDIAAGAVLLAVAANILSKTVMALSIGGRGVGLRAGGAFAAVIAAGAAAFLVT